MLDLPDLTLVAVYTVAHELTEMAVADCTRHVRFGDVKLFTDRPLRSQGDAIQIEPFGDLMQAGAFTTYEVPRYIKTSHVLFIHWDSWIVDPSIWPRSSFIAITSARPGGIATASTSATAASASARRH